MKNLTVFLLVFASVILAQTADVKVCVVKPDNSPILSMCRSIPGWQVDAVDAARQDWNSAHPGDQIQTN